MLKLFIIIVTYNGKQWYDQCLGSLRASEFPVQTIVVDNASSDDTVAYIRKNYPEIILIESDKNLGFGQGNNLGIHYALENGADYVFLLNQDAWLVEPHFFVQLLECAENRKDFAIISPLQLYGSGKQLTNDIEQHLVDGQSPESDLISDLFFARELKDIYEVPYVCAASWLIPKNILNKIGGFDPIFFHYGEDDNYLHRVFYHGYMVGVCPQVSVCHDVQFRENENESKHQNWEKDLLLKLTNINDSVNISEFIRTHLIKLIGQFLFLRIKRAKRNFKVYQYVTEMRGKIEFSRAQNKLIKNNWL